MLSLVVVYLLLITQLATSGYSHDLGCSLPDCRCFGDALQIPGNLRSGDIPQIVVLTFDDGVTISNYPNYYEPALFERKNPNGCPVGATFFVSHEYTDYTLVNDLHRRSYEIASHSVTHSKNIDWVNADYDTWESEIVGLRTIASIFGNIPGGDIKGMRAPFLNLGGNNMFSMLKNNGFEYDCSWTSRDYAVPGLWPYTLDCPTDQDCQIGLCPDETFAGVWVAPMNDLTDVNGNPCSMLDACWRPTTEQEAFDLMQTNFLRYYQASKTAFGLYVHASWFVYNENFPAYLRFLDYLGTLEDVYIVTISQFLEWVKNPTPLSDIDSFAPWNCSSSLPESNCAAGFTCHYPNSVVGDVYMGSCVPCPPNYPWVDNPEGN